MNQLHNWSLFSQIYNWLTERLYHELAWAYDPISWVISGGEWAAWRKEVLPHILGRKVLELGFGTGELLIALHHCGFVVCGVDPSPAMHKIAARKLRQQDIRDIPRVCGLAQHLPFPGNYFDSVVATFPSAYIFDPNTLAEVKRVLRLPSMHRNMAGGRFIVVGLYADYRGKTFGWVSEEYLLNDDKRSKWAPGWNVKIIKSTEAKITLPIVILDTLA